MRFSDARLHAVSSRKAYSLHGFVALMRPSAGQVCHSLKVVSNCTPGSAQLHAANAIWSHSSRAFIVFFARGAGPSSPALAIPVRQYRCHGPSFSTAFMKSLVIRTELLLFWPDT